MSAQQCETCVNPTFCKDCKKDRVIVTTPITRAFDVKNADGSLRHIVVGYGVLLNELDDFGTALSRELVESSIPLLRKYPAVRYLHKEPFGHIVFDESVEGFQTQLDENGFFVVAEIGANFEKEFSLIQRGGWGFSWGMFPDAPPVQKKVGGKVGRVFEKGRLYEISVVDVPAQPNASITVIRGKTMAATEGGSSMDDKDKSEIKEIIESAVKTETASLEKRVMDAIKASEDRTMDVVKKTTSSNKEGLASAMRTEVSRLVGEQIKEIDAKLAEFRTIQLTLQRNGEDISSVRTRIVELEEQKRKLESIPTMITDAVNKAVDPIQRKIIELSNTVQKIPDLRSPASNSGVALPSQSRSMGGFKGMVEAAFRKQGEGQ